MRTPANETLAGVLVVSRRASAPAASNAAGAVARESGGSSGSVIGTPALVGVNAGPPTVVPAASTARSRSPAGIGDPGGASPTTRSAPAAVETSPADESGRKV